MKQSIPNNVGIIKQSDNPWITCQIKNLIRKRKRYHKKFSTSNLQYWAKYKTFRNRVVDALRMSRSRKENPQKLTQLSSRSHPRHLVGKRTAQKDTSIDITSDSQVNSFFPYRWSPASLTFNNYFLPIIIFIYNVNNHK